MFAPYVEICGDEIIKRLNIDKTACDNYNFNDEDCCKKCDCQNYHCEPNEKMSCHRATVGEAITYFTDNMSSTIGKTFHDILSSSIVIKIIVIAFIIVIIGLIIYKIL